MVINLLLKEAVGEHFKKLYFRTLLFWFISKFTHLHIPYLSLTSLRIKLFCSIPTLLNIIENKLFYKSNLLLSDIFQDLCPKCTFL